MNEELARRGLRCSESFRLGKIHEGNESLAAAVDSLLPYFQNKELPEALPILQQILEAQVRRDYLCIADLLEFELVPTLLGTKRDQVLGCKDA